MKKLAILFLFLVYSLSAFNQESKINLGVLISPSINYRLASSEAKNFMSNNRPIFTSDFGVIMAYNLNDKKTLESGIIYSFYGYKAKDELESADGIIGNHTLKVRFNSINIPLILNFNLKNNNVISLGLANNINLKVTDIHKYDPETEINGIPIRDTKVSKSGFKELKDSKHRIYNPSFVVSYGKKFSIINDLQLTIRPSLNIQLLNYQKSVDINCYKFGVNILMTKNIN